MLTKPFSFRPTEEQISAAETVFMCMAAVDLVKPIVEEYQAKALRDVGYGHLPVRDAWTLPDTVWPVYHAHCQTYMAESGLTVDHPDHCPLLVSKNLLCQAQRVLADVMEPVSGISFDRIFQAPDALKNYDTLIDLNLRLLAPYCKNRLKG